MPDPSPAASSAAAEGLLTAARTAQLLLEPVQGSFDAAHLQEIHRRLFQDLPHLAPGVFRRGAAPHFKLRVLETSGHRYRVSYAAGDAIVPGLQAPLNAVQALAARHGIPHAAFAKEMADIYAQLDYLHPFHEGNSRALRVFTSQIAAAVGYDLHWGTKLVSALTRDRLYVARDKAVTLIAFPGLDLEKAMKAETRAEEVAYLEILARYRKGPTLESVIAQSSEPLAREEDDDSDLESDCARPRV